MIGVEWGQGSGREFWSIEICFSRKGLDVRERSAAMAQTGDLIGWEQPGESTVIVRWMFDGEETWCSAYSDQDYCGRVG